MEKVNELIERLGIVVYFNDPSAPYQNERPPYGVSVYLRAYLYSDLEGKTLYDQLDAAKREKADLEIQLGEAHQAIDRLKQELGQLPKPGPYDAVLGFNNKNVESFKIKG